MNKPKEPERHLVLAGGLFPHKSGKWVHVDDYDALRRYAEGLERDAERYRYLKRASKAEYLLFRGAFGMDDAAIDAAMKGAERE